MKSVSKMMIVRVVRKARKMVQNGVALIRLLVNVLMVRLSPKIARPLTNAMMKENVKILANT